MKLLSERESLLLKRMSDGNHQAFDELYHAYHGLLIQYCRPFITLEISEEEIVQEIFVELWEGRSKAVQIRNLKGYLLQTAKNKLLNIHRHVLVVERMKQEFIGKQQRQTAEDHLIFKEHYALFQNQLQTIPETKRQIFESRVFECKTNKQIADEVQLSESMVKKHYKYVKSVFENFLKIYR